MPRSLPLLLIPWPLHLQHQDLISCESSSLIPDIDDLLGQGSARFSAAAVAGLPGTSPGGGLLVGEGGEGAGSSDTEGGPSPLKPQTPQDMKQNQRLQVGLRTCAHVGSAWAKRIWCGQVLFNVCASLL